MVVSLLLYLCGVGAFLWSMAKPEIGFYYLIPLLPMQTVRYGMHAFPLGASMIDLVLLGVVIGLMLHKDKPLFADLPMKRLLVISAVYCYISLWHGSSFIGRPWPLSFADPRVSNCKNFLELYLLYAIAFATLKTPRQIRVALMWMCVATFLVSFLFFQDMNSHDFSHFSYQYRESGVMGFAGPNGLAAFEVQFALFVIGLYSLKLPRPLKISLPFVLAGCLYGVVFSFSRGAYLGFAAGIIFLVVVWKRSLLIPALAVFMGASVVFPAAVIERVTGTFVQQANSTNESLESSAQERMAIWQDALGMIRSHPIVGTGFNTYEYMHRVGPYTDTHNFYLKVLVEQGAIGLALFLAIIGMMLYYGFDLFRHSPDPLYSSLGLGYAVCIVGAIAVNFFGDRWGYLQVDGYWWVLLALVCRARIIGAQPEEEDARATELVPESAGA